MLESLVVYLLAGWIVLVVVASLVTFILWALSPLLLACWLLGLTLVQALQRLAQRLQPPAQLRQR